MATTNLTTALLGEDKVTIEDIASDLFTDDLGISYIDTAFAGVPPVAG